MPSQKSRYLIIGNGVAGITAASELVRRGAREILILTQEPHHYYFKPRLPFFLAGEASEEDLYVHPPSWYERRGIRVRLKARVERLIPRQKRVALADGEEIPYDYLLLATGSSPFVPPIQGIEKAGVFTLRTLEDAVAIKEYAARCEEAVVIGGGLLGLEAARGLKVLGLSVTVLERGPRLLPRQLDAQGAAVFQRLIEGLGLTVALNAEAEAILGDREVRGVCLKDGREFDAQLVLIAAGVRSNAGLAAEAGFAVERGVVVDERMQTSAPGVFAAGDVASFRGRSWGIIPVARIQAAVAAANMAGEEAVYEEVVPSNTLKIVGIGLTSAGLVTPKGEYEEIRVMDPEAGIYKKLVLDGNVPVGAIVIGDRALAKKLEKMVTRAKSITLEEAYELLGSGTAG